MSCQSWRRCSKHTIFESNLNMKESRFSCKDVIFSVCNNNEAETKYFTKKLHSPLICFCIGFKWVYMNWWMGSNFVFDYADRMFYKWRKISFKSGGSYTDSHKWIKKKKKSKNSYDQYFQYALTAALNHENIWKHPEIKIKIRSLINQYEWKEISFTTEPKNWKSLKQTTTITLVFMKQ